MKRWLVFLLCAVFIVAPITKGMAEGMLPSGLLETDLAKTVDAYVDAHRDTTAAVSVGIARGQRTLLNRAYGYADIAAGRPADADTVYEWGSATKLLVWVSVMQLVEDGRLDLDADIRTYLPDAFFKKLSYNEPITMLNLTHHNAGWEEVMYGLFVEPTAKMYTLEETLRRSEPRQVFAPGEVCAYSNWGVALAGLIVERISGESFFAYVQRHIFAPLSMERTALSPTLTDNAWVLEHRSLTQGYAGLAPTKNRFAIPLYPAGMATGTLDDFLRFMQALLPEEGAPSPLFKKGDTLSALFSPSLFYGNGDARNCHGLWALDFGVPVIGHGGNTAGFSSYLLIDTASNTGIVVMTNQAQESVYNTGLPELVFGKFDPTPSAVAMPNARELQGIYRSQRATFGGLTKVSGVLSMMPLFNGDENVLGTSLLGRSMVFRQVQPDLFVLDESSALMPISSIRTERTADGGARLTVPYFDFARIPTSEGIWSVLSLVLLAAAILYCAITLIAGGIRRLVLRIAKRRGHTSPMRKYHLSLCALGLAEGVNIAWLTINLMTYAPKFIFGFHIAFTWLYGLAALSYLAVFIMKARALHCGRKEKALYVWTGISGLIMLLNIVMWQFYRF